jgi:hypothetical protein
LFVALRLFSRADSRSGVHITRVFPKEQNVLDQYNLAKNVLDQFFSPQSLSIILNIPWDAQFSF